MLNEKLLEVMAYEGVVSIVTWGRDGVHVVNTWNSYLVAIDDRILVPAAGMIKTQKNVEENNEVKVTLGTREVMGYRSMGTGFYIEGNAIFLKSGAEFDQMKEKFPFLSRVLEITVKSAKQTL
jgi:methyl coenzyme M reductase alpha subunit